MARVRELIAAPTCGDEEKELFKLSFVMAELTSQGAPGVAAAQTDPALSRERIAHGAANAAALVSLAHRTPAPRT
jgi:hypothetical protein